MSSRLHLSGAALLKPWLVFHRAEGWDPLSWKKVGLSPVGCIFPGPSQNLVGPCCSSTYLPFWPGAHCCCLWESPQGCFWFEPFLRKNILAFPGPTLPKTEAHTDLFCPEFLLTVGSCAVTPRVTYCPCYTAEYQGPSQGQSSGPDHPGGISA